MELTSISNKRVCSGRFFIVVETASKETEMEKTASSEPLSALVQIVL